MSVNSKLSILLVEDNLGDAHLVRMYLMETSLKFELHHAESFGEGRKLAEQHTVDLVLLDLSLGDSAGFKTLTNFQAEFPHLPIIVMTGTNDEIVGNQAVKSGAQDFLVKGEFDGKLLGRVVRYSIQRHKVQMKLEESARTLAMSEKRFLEAQQMAHFGSWEMDMVTNEMKWSDETFRIFGFTPNSIMPSFSDYLSYVHVEDKDLVEDFFANASKDGQLHQVEHRIVIEGRLVKHVHVQGKAYYEEINDKLLLVGGIQDITERKLSEELLIEKNLTKRSSQLKEEILEDMGFHIRTPLSSIINLSFLMETTTLNSQQVEYVDALKTSVDDLSITVNNLLNFSVLVSEKINLEEAEFRTKDFIQSLEKVVKIKADTKNVKLNFNLHNEVPEKLIGDSTKLNQILYNLIDNAIKFSKENTSVDVNINPQNINGENLILQFQVADEGVGMSEETILEVLRSDALLKTNQSEDSKKKLGLAIVNKLIKTMTGKIRIDSKVEEGTSITIEIPLKSVKTQTKTASDVPEAPLKILLVEDHFLNQIATKKVLTTWSDYVTVDIAENGLVGVEKYREYGYDVVLMDIQMPVMDGMEAARKIRELSEVPIIALTANASNQEAEKCFEIGFNDYLSKPFNPKELYVKIMESILPIIST